MIRINKYLSLCGVTSRRGAEAMIVEGRVSVNDEIVEKVGTVVDETSDVVKVDGEVVVPVEHKVYVLMNKPSGAMTTLDDPFKRRTISHYLKDLPVRVYPIGRLDLDTEGVLLLTNDGELAYRLAHPRYRVKKIYEVKVKGTFTLAAAQTIESGIKLEDGALGKGVSDILGYYDGDTKIRMTLMEGRKREVKQLCAAVGHPVKKLRRIEYGGITVRGIKLGKWRYLSPEEIEHLKKLVGLE